MKKSFNTHVEKRNLSHEHENTVCTARKTSDVRKQEAKKINGASEDKKELKPSLYEATVNSSIVDSNSKTKNKNFPGKYFVTDACSTKAATATVGNAVNEELNIISIFKGRASQERLGSSRSHLDCFSFDFSKALCFDFTCASKSLDYVIGESDDSAFSESDSLYEDKVVGSTFASDELSTECSTFGSSTVGNCSIDILSLPESSVSNKHNKSESSFTSLSSRDLAVEIIHQPHGAIKPKLGKGYMENIPTTNEYIVDDIKVLNEKARNEKKLRPYSLHPIHRNIENQLSLSENTFDTTKEDNLF